MNTNTSPTAKRPDYLCTLCNKAHKDIKGGQGGATGKYDLHLAWREGGPRAIAR